MAPNRKERNAAQEKEEYRKLPAKQQSDAFREAAVLSKQKTEGRTNIIIELRQGELDSDDLKTEFSVFANLLNQATKEDGKLPKIHQQNITTFDDKVYIGWFNDAVNNPDRPPRQPSMKATLSFMAVPGQVPHLKLLFTCPEAIPQHLAHLWKYKMKDGKNKEGKPDLWSRSHYASIHIGPGALDAEKTKVSVITPDEALKEGVPELIRIRKDYDKILKKGCVRKIELHFSGLSEQHVPRSANQYIWSAGMYTNEYVPATEACGIEFQLMLRYCELEKAHMTLWLVEGDELASWFGVVVDSMAAMEHHPYAAYYENNAPDPTVQFGQKYIRGASRNENIPKHSNPSFSVFMDSLHMNTMLALSTIYEYDTTKSNMESLSMQRVEVRFIEAEGYSRGSAYFVFTSKLPEDLMSALAEGDLVKLCLRPNADVEASRFDATVVKPQFLPYGQRAFIAFRPFASDDRNDPKFEEFIKLSVTAMAVEEYQACSTVQALEEALNRQPSRKILVKIQPQPRVVKRNINSLAMIMDRDDTRYGQLRRILLGQDLKPRDHVSIYRHMANQPDCGDFPRFTSMQQEGIYYLKALPDNLGVLSGAPGTSKTSLVLGLVFPLLTNPRSLREGALNPERTFHQIVYTSDANATVEACIEKLQDLMKGHRGASHQILISRVHSLGTEDRILTSHDKDKRAQDPNRYQRPDRKLDQSAIKPESVGKPEPADKPESAGKPEPSDKPEPVGKPEPADKPESAGKPESSDKPEPAGKPESSDKPKSVASDQSATKREFTEVISAMKEALESIKSDRKIPGVHDRRLQNPEYSVSFRMLEILGLVPLTPAMQYKQPKEFTSLRLLWDQQLQAPLDSEHMHKFNEQSRALRKYVISISDVILSPLANLADVRLFGELSPDVCINDEATQSTETNALVALAAFPPHQDNGKEGTSHILVGDRKQIGPTVKGSGPFSAQLRLPWFSRLLINKYPKFELREVFRCSFGSINFSLEKYYEGVEYHECTKNRPESAEFKQLTYELIKETFPDDPDLANDYLTYGHPVAICNVPGATDTKNGTSTENLGLVGPTMDCLKLIATRFPGKSIGCIAPYTAMVDQLMKAYPSLLSQNKDLAIEVEFDTVDGFQGREKDFMVHVYPNTTSEGFTINDGRSNVTVTRAKFGAYTVTHVEGVASMENAKRNPFHAYLQHLIAECAQFRIPEKNAGTYNLTTKFSMKSTEPVEDAGADNSTDWGAPTAGADWGRPAPDLGVYQAGPNIGNSTGWDFPAAVTTHDETNINHTNLGEKVGDLYGDGKEPLIQESATHGTLGLNLNDLVPRVSQEVDFTLQEQPLPAKHDEQSPDVWESATTKQTSTSIIAHQSSTEEAVNLDTSTTNVPDEDLAKGSMDSNISPSPVPTVKSPVEECVDSTALLEVEEIISAKPSMAQSNASSFPEENVVEPQDSMDKSTTAKFLLTSQVADKVQGSTALMETAKEGSTEEDGPTPEFDPNESDGFPSSQYQMGDEDDTCVHIY